MHFVGQSTYYIQSGKYSSPGQIIFISTTKVKRKALAQRVVGRIIKTKVVFTLAFYFIECRVGIFYQRVLLCTMVSLPVIGDH